MLLATKTGFDEGFTNSAGCVRMLQLLGKDTPCAQKRNERLS